MSLQKSLDSDDVLAGFLHEKPHNCLLLSGLRFNVRAVTTLLCQTPTVLHVHRALTAHAVLQFNFRAGHAEFGGLYEVKIRVDGDDSSAQSHESRS